MALSQVYDPALALKALRLADFNAVALVQSVWDDSTGIAEDLHQSSREEILRSFSEAPELESYEPARSPMNPLIEVYTGVGGAGKTQLLGQIRKKVMAVGHHFVFIDMTGVNSFYPTVCLQLLKSLLQRTPGGHLQLDLVLANLFRFIEKTTTEEEAILKLRSAAPPKDFDDVVAQMTRGLALRFASHPMAMKTDARKDVLRALMMLGLSLGDERADAAFDWLQGGELEETLATSLKLPRRGKASDIIKAITWFMGFRAPALFAFDQLDVIVNQFETASLGGNSEAAATAKAAVIEIAGGLAALWEQVYRGQILISCLQQTWNTLKGNILAPVMERFCAVPIVLGEISQKETAKKIVELRLQPAYQRVGFTPRYPTFPFTESFFDVGLTPRAVIQKCYAHRKKCFDLGRVVETEPASTTVDEPDKPSVPTETAEALDKAYSELLLTVSAEALDTGTDASENAMGKMLNQVCELLLLETRPPDYIQAKIDLDLGSSKKNTVGLHSRLHLIFLEENDREEFFCFRALQHPNAISFQARLRAAITDSGTNLKLPFRRLVIVRDQPVPKGAKTKELVDALASLGGRILPVAETELRVMAASHFVVGKET